MSHSLSFTVGSAPDRGDLVADLICDDVVWAEINNERGNLEVEIYSRPDGGSWCFPLDDMMTVIAAARERLAQLRTE
ncbi:MAG TPA: hypothetical protein VGP96_03860 [Candidatus Dormibacteraeota bacterium]|jgi:hypothetical protein|nr:hypothetical protein [Candidatus Dormibacteraeota bacterium]